MFTTVRLTIFGPPIKVPYLSRSLNLRGGDYVLVMEDLPMTDGFYFGSENQSGEREDPVVTVRGRLRFQLPDVTELSNSEIQPVSDCNDAEAAAFDVQSSAPDILPFNGQCMSGRARTLFNFSGGHSYRLGGARRCRPKSVSLNPMFGRWSRNYPTELKQTRSCNW